VGAGSVIEVSAVVERVGDIATDHVVGWIGRAPRDARSAETLVQKIGDHDFSRNSRREVVRGLQAQIKLPRLAELTEVVERPSLRIGDVEIPRIGSVTR